MGFLGKILSLPVKIANIPFRAVENFVDAVDGTKTPESDKIFSAPLKSLSDTIEEL